ncbi:MAG TPA: glycosyltransferase family 39 protein [Bacteroidales bacterium]|nr:glycosyltransferase family 39 protein [Bacteroidales bacterium]
MKIKMTKPDAVILFIALFNVAIHLAAAGNLGYHRDEMLYFTLGAHPAAGYATVPPLTGLIAWLVQNLFGFSVYAVRLFPSIASGIMIFFVAGIARELGGSRYAAILSAIGFTITGFALRTFTLFMPVYLDVVFWTLIIYLIIRYINTEKETLLIWFGLVSGLSLLNKYLPGILFLGLLAVIPFTQHRKIFSKKMFWFGIIAGFLVFLPNLIWQITKEFPVVNHLSELNRTQLTNVNRLTFIAEQFMMASWASVLFVAGLIYLFTDKKASRFRFLGYLAMFVIIFLMLIRGKSYYTIGVIPVIIAAGSVSYDKNLKTARSRIILPVALVLLTIPILPLGMPVVKTEGLVKYFSVLDDKFGLTMGRRFEDNSIHSLPQDYADMLGWDELAQVADSAWQIIGDKKAAFIYAENYGEASAVTIIGKKYNLPEAISFNESFMYWFPGEFNPDITSVVYINSDEPGEDVKSLFKKIIKVGGIKNPHSREYGTSVYLCQEPVESFNSFWKARTKDLR